MIAVMPPALLDRRADTGDPGAAAGAGVMIGRHTQPTLFAITTTESSSRPIERHWPAHCCAESGGSSTFWTPMGA